MVPDGVDRNIQWYWQVCLNRTYTGVTIATVVFSRNQRYTTEYNQN